MTDMYQDSTRTSGRWLFPHKQDLGHAMLATGIGATTYGLTTVGYPSLVLPLASTVAGMILCERGWTMWRKGDEPPMDDMPMMDDFGMGMGYPGMPDWGMGGNMPEVVSRLMEVVNATWKNGELEPVWDAFELEGEELISYALRATQPGFFTNEATKTQLTNKLTNAVPASRAAWATLFDNKTDTVTFTQKSSIPKLALPPNWEVVDSAKKAGVAYKKFEMTLGPGEDGMVTFKPQVFPHVAVIATSGGGKSVFLRACAEQMRAVGGQIVFGDGKGVDYSTLRNQPGVVAIGRGSGSKGVEYIAAIELAFRIMQQRQNSAAERKDADPENWENLPPIFLVLDELKSVLKKWSTELDKKSFKAVESKVNQILALGRQLRVHVYTASQDVYAESIPPSWLTNIGMKISLGKPHHLTISKGFDEAIRGDATRIAAGIDPNVRGRGMIAGVDEDSGTATVRSYQGFLGYSPGEATPGFLNHDQKEQWNSFRKNVSEAIPTLYSRKWFKIDEPSDAQVKKEADIGRELGYIDFELFTVDEISELQIINLDMRDENDNIVPDPEMRKYDPDPTNAEYVCKPIISKETTVTDI